MLKIIRSEAREGSIRILRIITEPEILWKRLAGETDWTSVQEVEKI